MKSATLLTILCLLSFASFSQQTGTIAGKIADKKSGQPLPFTTVALYNAHDSTLINGVLAGADGAFVLEAGMPGRYYLEVRFIGYDKLTATIPPFEKGKNRVDMPLLLLAASSTTLNELQVKGEKEAVDNKIDRQVYRADQFLISKGGTALDVLRNTPSVTVNAEGDVTLRGSSGFMVLINGKPVQTNPSDVLNMLPANAIQTIEIITSPSARYDPDGKGGIINIITKQAMADSYAFNSNVQGGLPAIYRYDNLHAPVRYGADATFSITRNKWEASAGANYQRNDLAGRRVGDVNTTIGDRYTTFPSAGERSFIRSNYTARASATFRPDKSNAFSAGIYHGYRSQSRRADILYHNTKTNLTTGTPISEMMYFNSNIAQKNNRILLGNLDYTHQFGKQSTLTVSGLYEQARFNGLTTNRNVAYPQTDQTLQYTENPSTNPLKAYRLKADYNTSVGAGKLEIGYQFRYQLQKGDFQYLVQNPENGQFVADPAFSSNTRVTNQIHSVYGQYSAQFKKLDYQGGLRYEYATRSFVPGTATPRQLDLSNFFPSLQLQYNFNPKLRAKAGYSKRVQRSTNNELNPYPEREHSETLEQGDPDILPEFISLSEVGIIKDFESGSFFSTVYNQRIKNVVNRVNSVYNDTILNRIYTNAGNAIVWGIETGVSLKPTQGWQLFLSGNVYNYDLKGTLFQNQVKVNTAAWIYSINANTSFQLPSGVTFQWNINYLSERVTAQGKDSRFVTPGLSVKKTFLKGKLTALLQWQNMDLGLLGANQQRITTWGKDFYTTTNYIQETDVFLINLSYSLNQLARKAKLPASEFGDKEF